MSIEVRNVSKRFGSFQALDDVSIASETSSSAVKPLKRFETPLTMMDTRRPPPWV